MTKIAPGRMTAEIDGDYVVFLLGMRVNRWWKPHKWLPVWSAVGAANRVLRSRPDLGYLGGGQWLGRDGAMLVQYWRSVEQLERFARDPSLPHQPAWQRFNRAVGGNGDVGVWHEMYLVQPGGWEAIYVNMPRLGLATATAHVPVGRQGDSSQERRARAASAEPPHVS
ncbi:DUF4188 domain-containing protein [Natronosporangium hydrolyticum]|uniref:DUF4188 domain-containing protein n=1 Tax=Natronosporangium hydrolyticum TaxID=2811111 RepID=A0A895YMF4_9ACTN|nr:DUF4188 domain-containing protein [Natronosporangium hydrolyticum]QSB15280.1 DUF4188 domain-containing protein [Natronosporangium hydrolyticum]